MDDADKLTDDAFTLLGVREDGVASVVDLVAGEHLTTARSRAEWLLRDHASCRVVEIWRGGVLIEEFARPDPGLVEPNGDRGRDVRPIPDPAACARE